VYRDGLCLLIRAICTTNDTPVRLCVHNVTKHDVYREEDAGMVAENVVDSAPRMTRGETKQALIEDAGASKPKPARSETKKDITQKSTEETSSPAKTKPVSQ